MIEQTQVILTPPQIEAVQILHRICFFIAIYFCYHFGVRKIALNAFQDSLDDLIGEYHDFFNAGNPTSSHVFRDLKLRLLYPETNPTFSLLLYWFLYRSDESEPHKINLVSAKIQYRIYRESTRFYTITFPLFALMRLFVLFRSVFEYVYNRSMGLKELIVMRDREFTYTINASVSTTAESHARTKESLKSLRQ